MRPITILAGCLTLALATAAHASTEVDQCAQGFDPNATASFTEGVIDSYTRTAHTINVTCPNLQGSASRDATVFDLEIFPTQWHLGYALGAAVESWTNVDTPSECHNSTLTVFVHRWNGTQFVPAWSTTVQPVWENGACSRQAAYSPQGVVTTGKYRIVATAVRGLASHANETVQLHAYPL